MTQNPYQQGPPQGQNPWGTPPPQQGGYPPQGPPPGPAPWPPPAAVPQGVPEPGAPQFPGQVTPQEFQQGYPTTPVHQQVGPAPAPNAAGNDPFSYTPPAAGSGVGMDQLVGRLLLIRPYDHNPAAPGFQGNPPSPLIMADVVVCDGEAIPGAINGTTRAMTPFADGPKQVPAFFGGVYIRGAVLVPQLVDFVPSRGFFLGRLYLGEPKKGMPPKILAEPTEADRAIGRQVHARWDELKAIARPAQPDQFASPGPQQWPQGPPQGYAPPAQYQQAAGWPSQ